MKNRFALSFHQDKSTLFASIEFFNACIALDIPMHTSDGKLPREGASSPGLNVGTLCVYNGCMNVRPATQVPFNKRQVLCLFVETAGFESR